MIVRAYNASLEYQYEQDLVEGRKEGLKEESKSFLRSLGVRVSPSFNIFVIVLVESYFFCTSFPFICLFEIPFSDEDGVSLTLNPRAYILIKSTGRA